MIVLNVLYQRQEKGNKSKGAQTTLNTYVLHNCNCSCVGKDHQNLMHNACVLRVGIKEEVLNLHCILLA